ncbi:hypothetical protein ACFLS9_06275 [Bacteroidota bacterium]
MMTSNNNTNIIIYGTGKLAKIIFAHNEIEELYNICVFCADKEYRISDSYLGLEVVNFDEIKHKYPPEKFMMLVAIGHAVMRNRELMFNKAKNEGYKLVNYISPCTRAYNFKPAGENNIIYGGSYLGPYGKMGNNNVIAPNNYIGHDIKIGNHNYITPACKMGGNISIGDLNFIGIGSTIINNVTIKNETLIGAGSLVVKDREDHSINVGSPAKKVGSTFDHGVVIQNRGI